MAGTKETKPETPEALSTFDAAAKAGGAKPKSQGLDARPETAPQAGDLAGEEKDAADILAGGANKDPGRKDAAIARRRDEDERSG